MLFEALLLALSSTSTPFLPLLSAPHLCYIWTLLQSRFHLSKRREERVRALIPLFLHSILLILLIGTETGTHIHHLAHCRDKERGGRKIGVYRESSFSLSPSVQMFSAKESESVS